MSSFIIVLNQLIQFSLMILLGCLLAHFRIVQQKETEILSKLVVKVLLPAYCFTAICKDTSRQHLSEGFVALLLGGVLYIILGILFAFLSKILNLSEGRSKVFQASFIFGNTGFIGFPIVRSLYGGEGVIYMSIFSIAEQCMLWSYGMMLLDTHGDGRFHVRNLISPNLIILMLSIFFLLTGISLPDVIINTTGTIEQANTAICMLYLGITLYFSGWQHILKEKNLYIGLAVKMLIVPFIVSALLHLLPINQHLQGTLIIISALPTMTVIPMLAKTFGNEEEYVVGITMGTLLFSLLTLPVVSFFAL